MVTRDSATLDLPRETAGSGSATRPPSNSGLSTRYLRVMVGAGNARDTRLY
jgi:hypothetical protein